MTISREIKKALNAAFNNGKPKDQKIKFSVKTRRVSCADEITVSWVGGVFENEVWEVVKPFHTLVNKSDAMTDYFFLSGVGVELNRDLSTEDVEFLQSYVVPCLPFNYGVDFKKCYDSDGFEIQIKRDGGWVSRFDDIYQIFKQYNEDGAISEEIPSYAWEEAWQSTRIIEDAEYEDLSPSEAVAKLLELPGDLSTYRVGHYDTADKVVERLTGLSDDEWLVRLEIKNGKVVCNEYLNEASLEDGDYQEGDDVCITIHWSECRVYKEDAKFGSFTSAQKALENIALSDETFNTPGTGYTKVKYSIHWATGESWEGGRIDLACDDENPFELEGFDNLFQKHIHEFIEWQVNQGECTREDADEFYQSHPLTDNQNKELKIDLEPLLEVLSISEIMAIASELYGVDLRPYMPQEWAIINDIQWFKARKTAKVNQFKTGLEKIGLTPKEKTNFVLEMLRQARLSEVVDNMNALAF